MDELARFIEEMLEKYGNKVEEKIYEEVDICGKLRLEE